MDYSLSDADVVVALVIGEAPGINGYTIRKRAEERGLDAWAGVASSSIYNTLKSLEHRGLATSEPDTNKLGRGPRGRSFELTASGKIELQQAIVVALQDTRENDPRFNVALAGLDTIPAAIAVDCLRRRAAFLEGESDRLRMRSEADTLPLSAALLFDRIIHAIEAERAWVQHACHVITSPNERHDRQ